MEHKYNTARLILCISMMLMLIGLGKAYGQTTRSMWVGETFRCEASSAVMGLTSDVQWTVNGGYISLSGSGFYRDATVTQYFSGTAIVKCSWKYRLYANDTPRTQTVTWTFTCRSNDVKISPSKMTLAVGETRYVSYSHSQSNSYTYAANAYFSTSSTCISLDSRTGEITALKPGTAYVNVYSKISAVSPYCFVTVEDIQPTDASVSSPISIEADDTKTLSVSVSPSNATVSSKKWYIDSGEEYISLTSSGNLTGLKPGTAEVYCVVNGSVTSNIATVNVSEPEFKMIDTSPKNNDTGESAFVTPSVTFSTEVYQGTNYSSITLKDANGTKIDGIVERSRNNLKFLPSKPLKSQTQYTLLIPAQAVKNKWGTHYTSDISLVFKTGDYEKLTLQTSVTDKFLPKGDKISLTASKSSAKIYYTLNGSTPTANSTLYTGAITFENDIKLRAIAMSDGYESSDVLSMDYYLTNVEVKGRYPDENTQLFIYEDVNPSLTFSNKIEPSDNINSVSVLKNGKDAIVGEVIVADSTIYFVPNEPLELGCYYKVSVPQNAIATWLGEENDATSWTFSTGDFATAIAMGGEVSAAIKTDGSLLTWGEIYTSGNSADGSYANESRQIPETFVSGDVASVSAGYMHNAIIKTDGTLWMWGRQYCGEFGNNSTVGSASPVKIMSGVSEVSCGGQSSAIVKTDGSLWMVGRNDFGQIGDSTIMVRKSPVKIMDDVSSAVAGWCSSYAIKNDGTLMAWGRNDNGQLGDGTTADRWEPTNVMTDVAVVSASQTESQMGAAIKTDGSLWIWGNGNPSPQKVIDDVSSVSAGADHVVAVMNDGTMWKCSIDNSELMAESISDVAYNGSALIALKKEGSVWTGTDTDLSEKKVEGRSSSVLAGLYLNRSSMRIAEGTRSVLVAKPVAINADYSSLFWECNNEEVIEVSDRGIITAKTIGETDITVIISDDKGKSYTATCHVNVVDPNDLDGINDILMRKQSLRAWANNNVLHITGLTIGAQVRVYDTNGSLLENFVAESTEAERTIHGTGVYIIRSRNESVKVLNR